MLKGKESSTTKRIKMDLNTDKGKIRCEDQKKNNLNNKIKQSDGSGGQFKQYTEQ